MHHMPAWFSALRDSLPLPRHRALLRGSGIMAISWTCHLVIRTLRNHVLAQASNSSSMFARTQIPSGSLSNLLLYLRPGQNEDDCLSNAANQNPDLVTNVPKKFDICLLSRSPVYHARVRIILPLPAIQQGYTCLFGLRGSELCPDCLQKSNLTSTRFTWI
ncbi:hypothetical protein EDB83DRAFT_1834166 [Lactarius deliciosus]|nr:hypothetical protein EDB83DRAFT_1834166 [Lactarius deliciosus]